MMTDGQHSIASMTLKPASSEPLRSFPLSFGSLVPWGLVVAALAIPAVSSNSLVISLLTQVFIFAIFAQSYNLLLGETGLLSFGHAIYFGIGGYSAVHFIQMINGGLPVPIIFVPIVGGVAALVFGALIGLISVRRPGVSFAMITLGFGEFLSAAVLMADTVTGGEAGLNCDRTAAPAVFGFDFGSSTQVYYLVLAWMTISLIAMFHVVRTPLGLICNAIRENERRIEFLGYSSYIIRYVVFVLATFFAGIAGSLNAIYFESAGPDNVATALSATVLMMVIVGGTKGRFGPMVGAAFITALQLLLSQYTPAWRLYLGILFVAIILFAPSGFSGVIDAHLAFRRSGGNLARLLLRYLTCLPPLLLLGLAMIGSIETLYRSATQSDQHGWLTYFGHRIELNMVASWITLAAVAVVGAIGLLFAANAARREWRSSSQGN
jgi:branched-chain amino acid transport system permease protein